MVEGQRRKGVLLALLGVLCVSPDSVLLRYAQTAANHTDDRETLWAITCYKALALALCDALAMLCIQRNRNLQTLKADLMKAPRAIALATVFQTVIVVGFPIALLENTAARALLIISLNPMWAAIMGRIILKDRLRVPTMIALACSIISIGLVFVPDLIVQNGDQAKSSVLGDLVSVAPGLAVAAFPTTIRWILGRHEDALVTAPAVLAPCCAFVIFLPVTMAVGPTNFPAAFYCLSLLDGVIVSIVTVLSLTLAPRYITSAELGSILLLENILGPLWVFCSPVYREIPSSWTLIGGSLLLCTLFLHEVALILLDRRSKHEIAPIGSRKMSDEEM